ncbi:MAG: hypothetical protein B6D41_19240 [Chloroflexi bacterium UTCFX4]|nr:MAG: hypothetical protein B6D41_19240 [Chloroflexi bacterium UTCFX4]
MNLYVTMRKFARAAAVFFIHSQIFLKLVSGGYHRARAKMSRQIQYSNNMKLPNPHSLRR